MPCRDDYGDSGYAQEAAAAGRAACDLAKVIRKDPKLWVKIKQQLRASTVAWIADHDKEDAEEQRQAKQEAESRRIALKAKAKLTPREREVLGIR